MSKVPSPAVVHNTEAAPPPKAPARVCVEPSQIVASASAVTVAMGFMVSVIASTAVPQGPAPSGSSDVIVSTTVGEAISAVPGV